MFLFFYDLIGIAVHNVFDYNASLQFITHTHTHITHHIFPFLSYGVMMSCWGELPDNRPSFAKLVETLTSTLEPRQTTVHCTTTKNTNGSGYDRLEPKVFTNSIVCESKQIINGLQ